jgi:hypothetical protein
MHRENIFKNVVMRRVLEIKIMRKMPKLGDVLKKYHEIKVKHKGDEKAAKEDFRKKFLALYDEN